MVKITEKEFSDLKFLSKEAIKKFATSKGIIIGNAKKSTKVDMLNKLHAYIG